MAAPFPSPTKKWHSNTYQSISPTRPELSAKGKTVIVTGGGTGIGAETARYFAQAGASRIAILGRREQPLLDTKSLIERESAGVEVFAAPTDVTNKTEVDTAFSKFVGDGKIHVLVSNAAIIGPQDSVREADGEKFLDAIHKNLKGTLNVAQAFLRYAAPDAVAIDVNSSAAHVNFAPGFASYSVAKLGVFRIWNSLGFAHPEMSIFHIQPGIVDTAMNKEAGGVAAMGFSDDGKLEWQVCRLEYHETNFLALRSFFASELQCLARKPRSKVFEGKILVDELGCR
jgi:NAD(P)-dependent dehydrogenase (short-subunit alcohol dehydrogenase family)